MQLLNCTKKLFQLSSLIKMRL